MLDLTELFVFVDDISIQLAHEIEHMSLELLMESGHKTQVRKRKGQMSDSEVATILIQFHRSSFRNLKHYYLRHVTPLLKPYFPGLVSYSRFVRLSKRTIFLLLLCMERLKGHCTGINFADAMAIAVCHNKRIERHRVFFGLAKRSQTTMGWVYGFKLHLVINENGCILGWCLTPANVDERTKIEDISKNLFGKLYADKGYISRELFERLYERGLTLVTKVRKNMKNRLISEFDQCMLRKRAVIESVNDQLKNISMIEHSRHRCLENFLVNVVCALIAYSLQAKKPSLRGKVYKEKREVVFL